MSADWSQELTIRFVALCLTRNAGSYRDIAEQLTEEFSMRITKNACIGKARRLGVSNGNGRDFRAIGKRKKPKPPPKPPKKPDERPGPKPKTQERARPTPVPRSRREQGKVSLFDIGPHDCRWPFGDRPPFLFCGAIVRQLGDPYCTEHACVAWPSLRREQEARR